MKSVCAPCMMGMKHRADICLVSCNSPPVGWKEGAFEEYVQLEFSCSRRVKLRRCRAPRPCVLVATELCSRSATSLDSVLLLSLVPVHLPLQAR